MPGLNIGVSFLPDSILNVHENFFKLFKPTQGGYAVLGASGYANFSVPIFYASESNVGFVGSHREVYPQIIIQDNAPVLDDKWTQIPKEFYAGYYEAEAEKKVFSFMEPIRLKFSYEVSAYSRDPFVKMLIQDQFYRDFFHGKSTFLLNDATIETVQETISLGTPVSYKSSIYENVRPDGIRELIMSIEFSVMVYYHEPVEMDAINTFNLGINTIGVSIQAQQGGIIATPGTGGQSGDSHTTFVQDTPDFTWIFTHNLGFSPTINVYDNYGKELIGYNRSDADLNTIILTFGIPSVGKIIAS